jgi:hypothetical protein
VTASSTSVRRLPTVGAMVAVGETRPGPLLYI